jgi:hypothetical protein
MHKGIKEALINDFAVISKAGSVVHELLEHACKHLGGLVLLREGVSSDELLQEWHVLLFRDVTHEFRVKEFDPELCKCLLVDVTRLEDAVKLEICVPVNFCARALHVNSDSSQEPFRDVREGTC